MFKVKRQNYKDGKMKYCDEPLCNNRFEIYNDAYCQAKIKCLDWYLNLVGKVTVLPIRYVIIEDVDAGTVGVYYIGEESKPLPVVKFYVAEF